jgi:hypothetical protein
MEFLQRKLPLVAAVAVVAVLLLGWVIWRQLGPPAGKYNETQAGPISPMSSMLGPDARGRPQTGPMAPPARMGGSGGSQPSPMSGPSGFGNPAARMQGGGPGR